MTVPDPVEQVEKLVAELRSAAATLAAQPALGDALATRLDLALHALHDCIDILEPLADGGDLIDDE